jgi:hypothetical protein
MVLRCSRAISEDVKEIQNKPLSELAHTDPSISVDWLVTIKSICNEDYLSQLLLVSFRAVVEREHPVSIHTFDA